MPQIAVQDLSKTYRVVEKAPGLRGALRNLFRRKYKEVHAVVEASFTIEPGELNVRGLVRRRFEEGARIEPH